MKRCVIYSRVSTFDKGQDNENQNKLLREIAERKGYKLVESFQIEYSA